MAAIDRRQFLEGTLAVSAALSGAELAVQQTAQESTDFNFLTARAVILGEKIEPVGRWYLQNKKYQDHPHAKIAKGDCARFLVQEAIHPTINRQAVVVGGFHGMPMEATQTAASG